MSRAPCALAQLRIEELAGETGQPTRDHRPTLGDPRACHSQRGPPGGTRKGTRAAAQRLLSGAPVPAGTLVAGGPSGVVTRRFL